MKLGKNYFPIPFDGYSARDVRILKRLQGGVIAYGRWVTLLGMLYQANGRIELDEIARTDLESELELDSDGLSSFLADCARCGMISEVFLNRGIITSEGVCERLAYIEQQRAYGKRKGKSKTIEGDPKGNHKG